MSDARRSCRLALGVVSMLVVAVVAPSCGGDGATPQCGAADGLALGTPCAAGTAGTAGLVCAEGACRLACAGPEDCGDSLGCRGGACLPCQDHGECPGQYACRVGAGCLPLCHDDADCKAGATCTAAGECKVLAADGAACGQGDDCVSGFCATGVCCATACTGGCETCAGTTPGVCEADPRAECTVKVPEQAATLAAALAAVAGGGTIELTGDLTESVVVGGDKSVRIRGVGDPVPTLQATSPTEAALTIQGTGAVEVERLQLASSAAGLRVLTPVPVVARQIVAHHNHVGIAVDHGGTWTPGAVFRLEESDVWLNTGNGLDVRSAPAEISRARLSANLRNVRVEGVHSFRLANSVVAQANGRQGAFIVGSDNVVIEGSLFAENYPLGGLWLVDTSSAQVRDSIFQANASVGLALARATEVQVSHVAVSRGFDPRTAKFSWTNLETTVEKGSLDLPAIDVSPRPAGALQIEALTPIPSDAWLGNGIEINGGHYVEIDATDAWLNEGSGIFVWDSSHTDIVWSDVYLNLRNGISVSASTGTWIYRVDAQFNQRIAVQVWDGDASLQNSDLSYNLQHPVDFQGTGFFVKGGNHHVTDCIFTEEYFAGMMVVSADTTVHAAGNTFSESPVACGYPTAHPEAITWDPGNSISCTTFAPECVHEIDGPVEPAPPPVLPSDL